MQINDKCMTNSTNTNKNNCNQDNKASSTNANK